MQERNTQHSAPRTQHFAFLAGFAQTAGFAGRSDYIDHPRADTRPSAGSAE